MATTKQGICEVHQYALSDYSYRPVNYCSLCDAWMCAECEPNLKLRAIAALKKLLMSKPTKQ